MEIKKALTFRASSIGDGLMAKYLLDNIHAQFPNAKLGIVIASRAQMLRDLFATYPYITVIEANRKSPASLWRLWRQWRGSDLVVTQYAGKVGGKFSLSTKLMACLLACRGALVGFADASPLNGLVYNQLLSDPLSHSPAEDERRALRAVGLTVPVPYPILTAPVATDALTKFNLITGRYVLVHLFSGSVTRGMHPTRRRELVQQVRAAVPAHIELLLTGGSQAERQEAIEAAASDARVIAGEANLQETLQLVQNAAAVVSLDTGLGHIAAQLHKPVCIISTCIGLWWWDEEQYGPNATYHVFSVPLHTIAEHRMDDYPDCLNQVDLSEVAHTVASHIQ